MKLKKSAFTNNVSVWTPSINDYRSNPDWGMEVGQSEKHTFIEDGIEEILTAMVYYKIHDENEVMVGLGKGKKLLHYNEYDDREFVLTSLFPKVYLNGKKLTNQKFLLYITKDLRKKNSKGEVNKHFERRLLKFNKNLTYRGKEVNKECIDAISNIYGQNSSWAILKMDILNEDELHLYGIKISDGERKYKNKDARNDEFEKLWKEQHPNEVLNAEDDTINQKIEKKIVESKQSPFTPTQIIYYGVPGCGKSHTVTTMLKGEKGKDPTFSEENQVVRTTFHPEYTNADFVGQVMPKVNDGDVEYEFKAGPFAVILKRALLNPSKPFYLIIEEINRGNAAAIFGDVFQLLDRLKIGETSKESIGTDGFENHYGKGWSEYFVMNADVNAYIRDANSEEELDTKAIDVSGIHFSSSTGLRLPPNLSIYATMNTSDQNVFTLDNAFQRRWDMELVPNTCKWDDADHKNQAQLPIGDTDIRWEIFREAVNSEISGGDFFNADDKQLGLFFIEADGEKIDEKKFANKVLKYLWTDVFKRNTDKIFKVKNLSEVVKDFTGTNAFDNVFAETFVQSLKDANDEIKNK